MEIGDHLAKGLPGLGSAPENFARRVEEMSNGRLSVRVYGAGEVVPPFEVFDAVSQGVAEMGHGASYYWKGRFLPLCSTPQFPLV